MGPQCHTMLATCSVAGAQSTPAQDVLAQQRRQYDAQVPKTILELQPFRSETRAPIRRTDGTPGWATLINLNPNINAWYLLNLDWTGNVARSSYHLESPRRQPLHLLQNDPNTVRIAGVDGAPCNVWTGGARGELDAASASGLPYAPLCAGTLYLRNSVAGHHTSLERVTDFLRDRVWGGEKMISFVKAKLYRDAFLDKEVASSVPELPAQESASPLTPLRAAVAADTDGLGLVPERLGLDLTATEQQLMPGEWYSIQDLASVFLSVIAPQNIERQILAGRERSVNPLSPVESSALVYLVAFDLQRLDFHFVLGTDHPRLDWSERAVRDPELPARTAWRVRLPW